VTTVTTNVEAQMVLALACLIVAAIVLGFAWIMGVFAVAPRRARQLQAAARPAIGPAPRRNVIQVKPTEIKVIDR
jgi:hypothetical protein